MITLDDLSRISTEVSLLSQGTIELKSAKRFSVTINDRTWAGVHAVRHAFAWYVEARYALQDYYRKNYVIPSVESGEYPLAPQQRDYCPTCCHLAFEGAGGEAFGDFYKDFLCLHNRKTLEVAGVVKFDGWATSDPGDWAARILALPSDIGWTFHQANLQLPSGKLIRLLDGEKAPEELPEGTTLRILRLTSIQERLIPEREWPAHTMSAVLTGWTPQERSQVMREAVEGVLKRSIRN